MLKYAVTHSYTFKYLNDLWLDVVSTETINCFSFSFLQNTSSIYYQVSLLVLFK